MEELLNNKPILILCVLIVVLILVIIGVNIFGIYIQKQRVKEWETAAKQSDENVKHILEKMHKNREELIESLNKIDEMLNKKPEGGNEQQSP